MKVQLPEIHDHFEPTRATLHAHAKAIAAVPRADGVAHPKWWHVSLKPRPEGLVTDPVPLPSGGAVAWVLDPFAHRAVMRTSAGADRSWDLRDGMTATELGTEVVAAARELGLEADVETERFEDDGPREYDPAAAVAYGTAFDTVHGMLERNRVTIGERVSPIQVWPHGFDLAFEWFGTRVERYDDEVLPAQLNLGFYPGGEPYFYSNPWPFDPSLTESSLPHGATWNTEGWQGSMLPYEVVRAGDSAAILAEYARAVFDAAAPTLGRE